jgi:hypothetical protein
MREEETYMLGLKVINNLASLLFFFGACKTGVDCAKHTLPVASDIVITSQSLNLPIFFKFSAKEFDAEKIGINIDKNIIFLIMDMGLDKFFVFH